MSRVITKSKNADTACFTHFGLSGGTTGTRSLTEAPRRPFTGRRVINSNGLPASSAEELRLQPLPNNGIDGAPSEGAERDTLPGKGSCSMIAFAGTRRLPRRGQRRFGHRRQCSQRIGSGTAAVEARCAVLPPGLALH